MGFKGDEHHFLKLADLLQFNPAPYMARAHCVSLKDKKVISNKELKELIHRFYELYFDKLSNKTQKELLEKS